MKKTSCLVPSYSCCECRNNYSKEAEDTLKDNVETCDACEVLSGQNAGTKKILIC